MTDASLGQQRGIPPKGNFGKMFIFLNDND
jgi:hypothetical protein